MKRDLIEEVEKNLKIIRRSNIFEKAGASLINLILVFIISLPLLYYYGISFIWKISTIGIFFLYNLYYFFFAKNRCFGMEVLKTHWNKEKSKLSEFIYIILYTLSFSTIFLKIWFVLDVFIINMVLQAIWIKKTGTTIHGYLTGKISVKKKIKSFKPFIQVIEYASISIISLAINLLIVFILTSYLKIFYLISVTIGFIIATIINYFSWRCWVFKKTKIKIEKGYPISLTIAIVALAIVIILTAFFVEILGLNYLLARFIAGIVIGIISYALDAKFTFDMPIFPITKKK